MENSRRKRQPEFILNVICWYENFPRPARDARQTPPPPIRGMCIWRSAASQWRDRVELEKVDGPHPLCLPCSSACVKTCRAQYRFPAHRFNSKWRVEHSWIQISSSHGRDPYRTSSSNRYVNIVWRRNIRVLLSSYFIGQKGCTRFGNSSNVSERLSYAYWTLDMKMVDFPCFTFCDNSKTNLLSSCAVYFCVD